MNRKKILAFLATASLVIISNSAFASNQSTVIFPPGQKTGSFHCTASADSATVSIDINRVDAQGFCGGSPYVTNPGHIANLPAKTLNQFAFNIKKDIGNDGSVDVSVSSGEVTCANGDAKRPQYAPDAGYCLVHGE